MTTWFDEGRGIRSGRIKPSKFTPPDRDNVFVLGAEALTELATISEGDLTELRQTVDLTGFDMLSATFDTIGTAMGQHQPKAGFDADPDMLLGFDFNVGSGPSKNSVAGGFDMAMDGHISVGKETYSPNENYCRIIPGGVGSARMLGDNDPQAFPATLPEWTLQWWMDFDTLSYAVSTGVSPVVFSCHTGSVGGIEIMLAGVASLHMWQVAAINTNGPTQETRVVDGFEIDAPQGWNLYTLRFKFANPAPTQLELFQNATLVGQEITPFTIFPSAPSSPEVVEYGDNELVGSIDDMRFLSRYMTDQEILASYNGCITNPNPIDYKWMMQVLIDGRVFAEREIATNERRQWTDFYVPCRLLTGPHDVAFRLKLAAA